MHKNILYYSRILKILGLKKVSENETCKIIDYIYISFISLITSWKIIFMIYYVIKENDYMIIFKNLFECSIIFQYYYGYKYFRTDHFAEIIKRMYVMYPTKFNRYIRIYPICLFIFSLIYNSLSIGFLFLDINNEEYVLNNIILEYAKGDNRILLIVLFFIENFFSINIYLLNAYVFGVVFLIISFDIEDFYYNLENKKIQYIPSELCNNMLRLRNDYEEALDKFNSIFSSLIFFGFVSLYVFFIDMPKFSFIQLIYAIIFIKLYIVYFYSLVKIIESKDKLQNFIYSNNIIEKLLSRKRINKTELDYQQISIILDSENAETLDWFMTYQIFRDEWDYFKFFGFVIDDINIFKKIFILIISLYATGKFVDVYNLFE